MRALVHGYAIVSAKGILCFTILQAARITAKKLFSNSSSTITSTKYSIMKVIPSNSSETLKFQNNSKR